LIFLFLKMKTLKKNYLKSIFVLLFLQVNLVEIHAQTNELKPIQIYEKEGLVIKSYDFKNLEPLFKQQNDTTYVINFWATWCIPCVEELPHFEKMNQKYASQKFKMILVSLDFPKMVESRVLPFVRKKKLQAEVVLLNDPNANEWIYKVSKEWSGAIPATVIYRNSEWKFFEKSFTEVELDTQIKLLIN
jgi:thiol-disulfide isomerase/thioredoxin